MTVSSFVWKVTRPEGSVLCFLCAWFMATLSEAPPDFRLYASLAAGLSCLGASVFHYGANSRVYSRKEERVDVTHPEALKLFGGATFALALILAYMTRSPACLMITVVNAIIIWFYAGTLSKRWITKNLLIALVCASPVATGWVVGTSTHPATIYIFWTVFLNFLAREVIKDVIDIKANHGIRVTLPMVIGVSGALVIAGLQAIAGAVTSFMLAQYFWTANIAGLLLLSTAANLIMTREPKYAHRAISTSTAIIMISFL